MAKELPHPEGWTFMNQSRESREMDPMDGKQVIAHFLFNNYYRTVDEHGDTRLMLMQVQVHE